MVPGIFIFAQEYEACWSGKKKQWIASAAILLAVSSAVNLPFIIYSYLEHGNIDMWNAVYLFHVNCPLYWDTLLGVAVLWLGYLPIERYAAAWSLGLIAIAALVKPKLTFEYRCVLMVIAVILCNRVYSTQFNLWFYPFLLFALDQELGTRFSQLLKGYIALMSSTSLFIHLLLQTRWRNWAPLARPSLRSTAKFGRRCFPQ